MIWGEKKILFKNQINNAVSFNFKTNICLLPDNNDPG